MKKTFYLLAFVGFLAPQVSFGQVWFNENAVWDYTLTGGMSPSYPYKLMIIGDTIVQGKNCKKLLGGQSTIEVVYESNDSVFLLKSDMFSLIYNFNMLSGDSIVISYDNPIDSLRSFILDSIGYISLNGEIRRVQYLRTLMEFVLSNFYIPVRVIEGIGMVHRWDGPSQNYSYFFINTLSPSVFLDLPWPHFCSFYDDNIIYDPFEKCIHESLSTKEPAFATQVIISPNPSSHHITLSYATEIKLLKASLLSPAGATLFTKEKPSNELTLDSETKGLFFLKLEFEEGIIMKKIIRN